MMESLGWHKNKRHPRLDASFACLVAPKGFEPSISWLRTMHPGPLDDGATYQDEKALFASADLVYQTGVASVNKFPASNFGVMAAGR